ncbi:uncharacterized protein METZ01_LOCUS87401, partial [marine metagenome]
VQPFHQGVVRCLQLHTAGRGDFQHDLAIDFRYLCLGFRFGDYQKAPVFSGDARWRLHGNI